MEYPSRTAAEWQVETRYDERWQIFADPCCPYLDVKVFGFLTIPDDAKIGVSAHEIGHLRESIFLQL